MKRCFQATAGRAASPALLSFLSAATASALDVTGDLTVTLSTTLGTSSVVGDVQIRPGGLVVAKGTVYSSPALLSGDQGAGTRMLWHPGMGAFRAGTADGDEWDEANIGFHSFAGGHGTLATGDSSVALGYYAVASGGYAVAAGDIPMASGLSSVALGQGFALGMSSFAAGGSAYAEGECSVALGSASALGWGSVGIGYGSATGDWSTSTGFATLASSYCATTCGRFNIGGGNPTAWVSGDPIFEIGNGDPVTAVRSNAVTVYKNGSMDVNGNINALGVITCDPGGDIPMFNGN